MSYGVKIVRPNERPIFNIFTGDFARTEAGTAFRALAAKLQPGETALLYCRSQSGLEATLERIAA